MKQTFYSYDSCDVSGMNFCPCNKCFKYFSVEELLIFRYLTKSGLPFTVLIFISNLESNSTHFHQLHYQRAGDKKKVNQVF